MQFNIAIKSSLAIWLFIFAEMQVQSPVRGLEGFDWERYIMEGRALSVTFIVIQIRRLSLGRQLVLEGGVPELYQFAKARILHFRMALRPFWIS